MAVCLIFSGGSLTSAAPFDVAAGCAGVVALAPEDVAANPFALSNADGAVVAAAVAFVWLAAWAFKSLIRTLRSDENE